MICNREIFIAMSEIDGENSNQKAFSSVEENDDLNKENLNLDVKNEETEDNDDILNKENITREEEIRKKNEHIIELENKLRFYQSLEINQKAMENQLKEIELKSNCYLNELTDVKMKHEIEVKELKDKIEEISSTKNEHASFSNDMDQLIQLNISIIAWEDDKDHDNSEENIKELTEKNSKLKKQIIKDKKLAKRLQEELEQIKNAFYELQSTSSLNYQQNSKELQILRDELIEKNEFINHLETENRQLEVQAAKASKEVENELVEQQIKDNQTDENEERSNEQNEQISQMHEDMRRLNEYWIITKYSEHRECCYQFSFLVDIGVDFPWHLLWQSQSMINAGFHLHTKYSSSWGYSIYTASTQLASREVSSLRITI